MSKKTTNAVTNAVVKPARVDDIESELKFGMDLDLRLNKDDLVNLVTSTAEEKLIVEREGLESQMRTAVKNHEKSVQRLATLAQAQLDGFTLDDETRTLLSLMQSKTGHAHVVKILNMNASTYSHYGRKPEEDAPDIDVKKLAIVGSAKVFKKRGDDNYGNEVLSWEVNIPFSEEMKTVVHEITLHAELVDNIKEKLSQIGRMIFDIPRLKNRAMRELTLAVAQGRVKTMKDATDVVMDTQSKALPESTPVRALSSNVSVDVSVETSDD